MELSVVLKRISSEFPTERSLPFSRNSLASFIRNDAARIVDSIIKHSFGTYIVKSSPGQGQWADVPWIAILNPQITSAATSGYYVVYLFHSNGEQVSLSLNQGITEVYKKNAVPQARAYLRRNANLAISKVQDELGAFDNTEISLGSMTNRPKAYEQGHILGKTYNISQLLSESLLREELKSICSLYSKIYYRLSSDSSADGNIILDSYQNDNGYSLIERKKYRIHRTIERNNELVKLVKGNSNYRCACCDFKFSEFYGDIGANFIEAHHLVPLSSLSDGEVRSYGPDDFAILCSNCHKMIHKLADSSRIDELKRIINETRAM